MRPEAARPRVKSAASWFPEQEAPVECGQYFVKLIYINFFPQFRGALATLVKSESPLSGLHYI